MVSTCNGGAGQQWSSYSDNTLRVQGGCLDVVSAGTTSGTNVDWYPCNGTAAQNWTHQSNGELVNPTSGLCLTDPGGNTGARLDIETCTGSAQQQWSTPNGSGGGSCGTTNLALNKAATASATAALAEIASSPRFRRQFPADARRYLAAAKQGWTFLERAIARCGKDGAYQRITHYGDEFMHDDELAWAAAELFLATGEGELPEAAETVSSPPGNSDPDMIRLLRDRPG